MKNKKEKAARNKQQHIQHKQDHGQIEVILGHTYEVPNCSHGPTLLFERFKKDGTSVKFFACAVCRARKLCSFYQLLTKSNKSTLDCIIGWTLKRNFDAVLCIGTPRLFETLGKYKKRIKRMLLDIDERYRAFLKKKEYAKFSMFVNYFFIEEEEEFFRKFLSSSKNLLIFCDPPFGALVAPLAKTTTDIAILHSQLSKESNSEVVWVFPYYMENKISEHFPQLVMMDYKINYDNHPVFVGSKSKFGSPVRFFSSINPKNFELPVSEGYRFCDKCEKYVSSENVHCEKCGYCTSKDGRTYQHCMKCERCVKPTYTHCQFCHECHLPSRACRKRSDCYLCGEGGHKRSSCPKRSIGFSAVTECTDSGKKLRLS